MSGFVSFVSIDPSEFPKKNAGPGRSPSRLMKTVFQMEKGEVMKVEFDSLNEPARAQATIYQMANRRRVRVRTVRKGLFLFIKMEGPR